MGVPDAIELTLAQAPDDQVAGLRSFLDALSAQGFNDAPAEAREQILHVFADASPEALAGVSAFRGLTFLLFYALPDPATGRNPNWEAIGYPGPRSAPPDVPKTIHPLVPEEDALTLEADVVVVGSGAGGGVIAGELAGAGKDVVVLETGGYYNEADFNQLELWAYQNLYRGGGLTATDDGSITLMAGSNLGGGTTVNWTNCLRTTPWVRERVGARARARGARRGRLRRAPRRRVRAHRRHRRRLGLQRPPPAPRGGLREARLRRSSASPATPIPRPTTPRSPDCWASGDQSGSKQGTLKTYLMDAEDGGARFVVRCRVDRILVEGGRAAGVEGTYLDEEGRRARVVVRAPQVVVAGGSLESPALLLRSGIGGPAVGDYLRLHPATAVVGVYDGAAARVVGPAAGGALGPVRRPRGRLRLPRRGHAREPRRDRRVACRGSRAVSTRSGWSRAPRPRPSSC